MRDSQNAVREDGGDARFDAPQPIDPADDSGIDRRLGVADHDIYLVRPWQTEQAVPLPAAGKQDPSGQCDEGFLRHVSASARSMTLGGSLVHRTAPAR